MRAALMRDGCRLIAALYSDRTLYPDDEDPRPCETRHRGRSIRVPTLFGGIDLPRSYYHHRPSGTGVPMRREALAGRPGKQEDGSARTREA